MESRAKYIGFDLETGGLDPLTSPILTGYFCALDPDLNILGELEIKVRPDPGAKIDEEALRVNKIDLASHLDSPDTLSKEEASKKLEEFLAKFGGKSRKDKNRPRPLGHNVAFDLAFLRQLLPQSTIDERLNYGVICTKVLSDFFKEIGVLPQDVGNLESLVRYFDIKKLNHHTAKDDTLMMVAVYGRIIQMAKGLGSGGGLSLDLLSMLEK